MLRIFPRPEIGCQKASSTSTKAMTKMYGNRQQTSSIFFVLSNGFFDFFVLLLFFQLKQEISNWLVEEKAL
jgi:hypothetical protein